MAKGRTRLAGRSAVSGRFVKVSYAKTHKRTTVVERLKKGKK